MTTMSREYAQALFELSAGEDRTEEVLEGLEEVRGLMAEAPQWRALLASPAIGKKERIQALEDVLRGRVPEVLLGVLRMMVSRGQIGELERTAEEYEALARDFRGEAIAAVSTAVPLTEEQQAALKQGLEKKFGRTVTLKCRVDPGLIGGVRVEMDGKVMDSSLRNKLEQIKEVMHG